MYGSDSFSIIYTYEDDALKPFINAVCDTPIEFTWEHNSDERKVRIKDFDYKANGTLSFLIDKDEFKSKFPELFKE